jgi:heterodisulfide reductase subunit B
MEKKLASAQEAGADYICSACTYCQLQFDHVRRRYPEADPTSGSVSAVLYPQLLGLAMGLGPERLGLSSETMPASAAFTARAGR